MFPDQGIGSFAPRRCKDNNFAVVGKSSFLITPSFLHLAGYEHVGLILKYYRIRTRSKQRAEVSLLRSLLMFASIHFYSSQRDGQEKKLEFEPFQPWSREGKLARLSGSLCHLNLLFLHSQMSFYRKHILTLPLSNLIESNRSPTMKSNAMATLVTDKGL